MSFSGNMEEAKEKFTTNFGEANTAFEELCAMVEAFVAEKDEKRAAAQARLEFLKGRNQHLREKNRRLRAKYIALLDM